jgi:GT2 family glycosyltransferase
MLDFSIVVPSYGRPDRIPALLESLAALNYPAEQYEVILIDDGSPVSFPSATPGAGNRLHINLLRQSNMGPAAARNYGAAMAKGRYLAFTDDDCHPDREWLRALHDALDKSSCLICGGQTRNGLPENIYSEASQLIADYVSRRDGQAFTPGSFFQSNNLALSAEDFRKTGGFDAGLRYGEDRDFCHRCACLGFSFVYVQDALIFHSHRQEMRSFIRLHYAYGGGTYAFRRGCSAKGLPDVPFNPPSWYVRLVLSGIKRARSRKGIKLSLLLMISQFAAITGMLHKKLFSH